MSKAATEVVLRTGRPLSDAQRALWASQRTNPNQPVQNMVEVATIASVDGTPSVDPARLADAFAEVVDHCDALRTRIVTDRGDDRVVIGPSDGSALTTSVSLPKDKLDEWVTLRSAVPIDMAIRCYDSAILSHEDGSTSWYLGLHHTVTDATSSTLLFRLTAAVYGGGEVAAESYYQWAEHRSRLTDRRIERAADHWQARQSAPAVSELYAGDRAPTATSHRVPVSFDNGLLEGLERRLGDDLRLLSNDLGWSTVLLTVAATLLHKVAGADRFAIGLPVHHRNEQASREVIGPVMQVYPVDIEVEPDDTFRSLYDRVARSVLDTIRHAGPAGPPKTADYQVVVNLIPELQQPVFAGQAADVRWIHPGATDPHHLLRMQFTRFGPAPELFVDINEAAAAPAQHQRVVSHVEQLLQAIASDPDVTLGSVALPKTEELAAISEWGQGPPRRDADKTHDCVALRLKEALAESTRPALCSTSEPSGVGSELTGSEVWQRVTATARWLEQQGVGPGSRVAITIPRSVDAVIAIFATIAAGGSFVPLDPAHPVERRQRMIGRAGCVLEIEHLPAGLPSGDDFVPVIPLPDAEAYLLFTSGSTGEPKGVPITNRGLLDYLDVASSNYVPEDNPPVGALFSALTFDLTITSLFMPLLVGGRLVVVEPEGAAGLRLVAEDDSIDWLKATPSHLELLLRMNEPQSGETPGLRTLVVGGEAFGTQLANRLATAWPEATVINEYGPTEAVVGCMVHRWSPGDPGGVDVPIGRPAPGVELRILDRYDQPVPIGASGELHIAHRGLTSGYLGGTGSDRFVELDGKRFYRSGDLVRLVDDRTLSYQGRIDEQLKVGGIRLDPTEVEHALMQHPSVDRAVVRLWEPTSAAPTKHCLRCGLPDNVPGATFDDGGICLACHSYDAIKDQAQVWFRTTNDLLTIRDNARQQRTGRYDAIHLLSGGKDSTYALYQLVELGFDVLCLTLDNGFVSEGALANVRRSVADLGIDHEIMTSDVMNDIFRDSLERHSNVCHGCYKTIYTLATQRAEAEGAPLIVTGLSRGQLFETRLIPAQFAEGRFDPEAIDQATLQARRVYHRLDDGPNRLLDTSVFDPGNGDDGDEIGDVFDRVSYIDFYRYVDVELAEMFEYLEHRAPWVRPADTGRSTNCLVNAAGIYTHLNEQGFHNYAEPYAWDVRLGHKTRTEAMEELDDQLDVPDVKQMLDVIGYEPRPRQILTAWVQGEDVNATSLRTFVADRLPKHAVPSAYVEVQEISLTSNGKVDSGQLPPPERFHRAGPSLYVAAETPLEASIVSLWENQLGVEPIGVDDDFFALGGDSLAALKMVVELSLTLDRTIREDLAFTAPTPRQLAAAVEATADDVGGEYETTAAPSRRLAGASPALSSGETALLFEHLSHPTSPRYNVARRYRVEGAVVVDRFVDAVHAVVDRHAPLHWTYGEERQRLATGQAISIKVEDTPADTDQFERAAAELHRQPFDVEAGPLGRCFIQPLTDGATGIVLVFHHLSIDAGTFDTLWSDLEAFYQGRPLFDLPIDYGDHTSWQNERNAGTGGQEAAEFWSNPDLARQPAGFSVSDGSVPDGSVSDGSVSDGSVSDGYVQRRGSVDLDQLRAATASTPFATALSVLAATLRPHVDGDAVPIAITASTRDHPAAEGLVGYYLNTLPLIVETTAGASLREVGQQTGELLGQALAHRSYPFSQIVNDRRQRHLPEPAIDVMLAFEELAPASLGTHTATHEVLASGQAVTGATFFVQGRGREITLGLEYAGRFLNHRTATTLLDQFDRMLQLAVSAPDTAIEVVDDASARQLIHLATGPSTTAAEPSTIQANFERFAREQPHALAVAQGGVSLSYAEVERRANLVANRLVEEGTGQGDMVGVLANRSPDAVVAILGVLKTGAAYVPIDPDYPEQRRHQISDDAGLESTIDGSLSPEDLIAADPGPPAANIDPDSQAYVIFTSGSTGRPKGVVVSHRNIVDSTVARGTVYPSAVDRFLLLSSFAFDSSMVGLWWTLWSGGTIVLPDVGLHTDTDHLASVISLHKVTHLLALPSLYRVLLEEDPTQFDSLTTAIVAGEPCPPPLAVEHANAVPKARLWNEYGPTEGTVWSHVHEVIAAESVGSVPIGRPIPNVVGHVLDADLRLVPEGQAGELVIGGAGIAIGYLNRPDLTEASFISLPELAADADGGVGRFYRTGDLVRWLPNRTLEFLGRIDRQVKIRGQRVELGEIEIAALRAPNVRQVVVDTMLGPAGRHQVALWFVTERSVSASSVPTAAEELLKTLRSELPSVMVPTHLCEVEQLPLTPNGKVDRDALPDPRAARTEKAEEVEGAAEQLVSLIWEDVLGVRGIGRSDNFFELGGDSIMSIQIVSRLRRRGLAVSTRDVFDHPTVAELASRAVPAGATTAEQGTLQGTTPLLPIQRWLLAQQLPNQHHFTQSRWIELSDDVDVQRLLRSLSYVIEQHDALRARLSATGTHLEFFDQASFDVAVVEGETEDASVVVEAEGLLNLEEGPTGAVRVFRRTDDRPARLFIAIHHLVIDAVSWTPLLDDWEDAYSQLEGRARPVFGPKSSSVRQWASALEQWAPTPLPVPDEAVPVPWTRSREFTEAGTRVELIELDAETSGRLLAGENVEAVLLAAVAHGLHETFAMAEPVITLEGHGRQEELADDLDLTRTVGWFTSHHRRSVAVATEPVETLAIVERTSPPHRGLAEGVLTWRGQQQGSEIPAQVPVLLNYLGKQRSGAVQSSIFQQIGPLVGGVDPQNPRLHGLGIVATFVDGRLALTFDHHPLQISPEQVAAVVKTAVLVLSDLASAPVGGHSAVDLGLVTMDEDELASLGDLLDDLDC